MTTFVTPASDRVARLRGVLPLATRPGLEMRPHRRPAPGHGDRSGPAPPAHPRRSWGPARSAPRRSRPGDRRSRRRAGGRRPGAGCAARASWPPFRRERCFRTAFSSLIVAPASRRRRVTACFSARLTPVTGAGVRAEPPPEKRQRTKSSGPAARASRRISSPAASPRASGIGCHASTTRTRRGPGSRRSFTATSPSTETPSSTVSVASAIIPEALPAPTTTTRRTRARSKARSPT